jgi:hypothetical protein
MFKRIKESLIYSLREETSADRAARMVPGALYGAFVATIYILALSTVNVITIPGLHLAVEWVRLLTYWIGFGLGLALAGVIVGWFTEDYVSIIGGGIVMTVLLLIGNFIISLFNGGNAGLVFQSVVTAVPLIGGAVLIAGGLRYVIQRHLQIVHAEKTRQRRSQLAGLFGIVFLVGLIPGVFSRFDLSTINMLKALNNGLQQGATDPGLAARFSQTQLPGLKAHFGKEYAIYPHPSIFSAGSLDITVRFTDGYDFSCVVAPDAGELTYFTTCSEGDKIVSP